MIHTGAPLEPQPYQIWKSFGSDRKHMSDIF
jgi:hypothetical protein